MKGPALGVLVLASTLAAWASGQELDTALIHENPAMERSTIIDQVADAQERRAFLQKRYPCGDVSGGISAILAAATGL
jgi:hypothetical protein